MTVIPEHETLARVDEQTWQSLEVAADNYVNGPARLHAAVLAAARKPSNEKPADIARAIGYAYTYDYVAKLVRLDRKANPGLYERPAADAS